MENSYRNIGKIVSGFGLKGDMIIQHHLGKKIVVSKIKVIFLEQKKDSKEQASKYIRRDVWLKEEEIQTHTQKNNPIAWVGYHVIDQGNDLGPVLEVIEQPHQILCRLEIEGKEVLIPVNEQTLRKIDHKTKTLVLMLPDGLLEVYLG